VQVYGSLNSKEIKIMLEIKSGMYIQCCVCKKFRLVDGTYAHVVVDETVTVSHTYCEECYELTIAEIMASK
jgi:hypothetical protein